MTARSTAFVLPNPHRALAGLASAPLARFLAVGLLGLAVDAGLFTLLHNAGTSRWAARAVSLLTATVITWTLNRAFTFASTGRRRRSEILRYGLVVMISQGISYGSFLLLSWAVPHAPPLAALVAGAVFATLFSFTGQRLFTFRPDPPRQP